MLVQELLLRTLEDLGNYDFKRFQRYLSLSVLDGYETIPKSRLENTSREDTVDKMVESYGEGSAVAIAVDILKKMNHNNAAEMLKKKYAGVEGTIAEQKPAASSSAVPPSTSVTISAQNGSVAITSLICGANIPGSFNMNVTK